MHDDQSIPVTLEIADCPLDLRVLGFRGQDGLNEVYRYDIDLVVSDPHLDLSGLTGRAAFLGLGSPDCGLHGQVAEVVQCYAGTCLSHYRLTLAPSLRRLDGARQRRVHANLTVPGLIARLLSEHGLESCDYAFDRPTGLYPMQAVRVQYDETDLQFLQRTCEEEGIHFRFEHSRQRHRLVFADDPASFAEHPSPLRFAPERDGPALRHLAQHWSDFCMPGPSPVYTPDAVVDQAIDGTDTANCADIEQSLRRQRAMRELQRLRCAGFQVRGASDRPDVRSGSIAQVLDHPETLFNDQWLITRIEHSAVRFEVLEGQDPHDVAAIVTGFQATTRPDEDAPRPGYRNRFDALPWAMTWRPQLEHPRPRIEGEQPATVMDCPLDGQGLVSVRYDWQPPRPPGVMSAWPLARVLRGTQTDLCALGPGARVMVTHVDGDPQQPVICGLEGEQELSMPLTLCLDGVPVRASQNIVEARSGQCLQVRTRHGARLQSAHGTIELSERSIRLGGMAPARLSLWKPETGAETSRDLRLTREAGPEGEPLAGCAWYIVRMARPGLEHLPRTDPRHILFEGTTDADGYLGLTATQRRQLATLYNAEPRTLCLAYPGHCLTLHTWLQHNLTERQRQAFRLSGL